MTPQPIQPTDQLALGVRSLAGSSAIHALVLGCLAWASVSDLPGPVGGEVRARRGKPVRIEFAMVESRPTEVPFAEESAEDEPLLDESALSESETFDPEGLEASFPDWDELDGFDELASPRSRAASKPAPIFVTHLEVPRTMVFAALKEASEEVPEPEVIEAEEVAAVVDEAEATEDLTAAEVPAEDLEELPADTPGEADVAPAVLRAPAPDYPRRAIRLGQEGAVTCRIVVDATGAVKEVTVAESSGFRLLDDAALAAVKKWKFEPGRLAGVPAEREVRHIVRFELTIR